MRRHVAAAEPRSVPAMTLHCGTLQMARGRAAFRAGDLQTARPDLAAAAARGDTETSTIASMLLGSLLVSAGDIEDRPRAIR